MDTFKKNAAGFGLACLLVFVAMASSNLSSFLWACVLTATASYFVYRDGRRRAKAESEMDRFFNISLDLLCISGMDGYFKRLSPSYIETLGYPLSELYRRPVVDFVHPEDVQRTIDEIERQRGGGKVIAFENRFRCADGSYKTLSWKSVPVGDFMYAVARDVTDQKKFERELMEAQDAANKAAVAKAAFLANMSHEIRTPLNGIVGMTDLFTRTPLNEEQKAFLDTIRSSAQILMKIVNEVLDFSKIEAGRVHVERIDFNLSQLIEKRISLVGVSAHEKGLKLEASVDPRIPALLRGDADKIGQVLMNLLNNSVKFTDSGKISVNAEVRTFDSSQCWVKIGVRDTGVGIAPAACARLFEPFTQADDSTARKYGGTGLGLSICKRYVELMNGDIGFESRLGEGSLFWFSLPLEISESESPRPSPKIQMPRAGTGLRASVRILIAEDNRINQMIVMNMMKVLGYTAEIAENGRLAVERFSQFKPDLILMDQHMPEMDGVEASAEIRRLEGEGGTRTPIIAFTATVIQEDEKLKFKELMDDFLLKPVTLEALETVLSQWEQRLVARKN